MTRIRTFGWLIAITAAFVVHGQTTGGVHGIVWDADGRPVANARIDIHTAGSNAQTVTTGPAGAFTAADLKPGHYELTATAPSEQLAMESSAETDIVAGHDVHTDLTLGKSTKHRGFWKRLVRRLDGLH